MVSRNEPYYTVHFHSPSYCAVDRMNHDSILCKSIIISPLKFRRAYRNQYHVVFLPHTHNGLESKQISQSATTSDAVYRCERERAFGCSSNKGSHLFVIKQDRPQPYIVSILWDLERICKVAIARIPNFKDEI